MSGFKFRAKFRLQLSEKLMQNLQTIIQIVYNTNMSISQIQQKANPIFQKS